MTTLARTTTRLAHLVRLRHATTGETITAVSARADLPPGWSLRVRAGTVVVGRRDGTPAPASPPTVTVAVTGPLALRVDPPAVTVPLHAPEITVDMPPVPSSLVVELVAPDTGAPRTGRTVTARATTGPTPRPTVALPEMGPGVYRSAATAWTAAFATLDLLVDGEPARHLAVDVTRPVTHVRLVDPT